MSWTAIIGTNPIETNPSTTMLSIVVQSLEFWPVAFDEIILAADKPRTRGDRTNDARWKASSALEVKNYAQFLREARPLVSRITQPLTWGHITGNIKAAMETVTSKNVLIVEHDVMLSHYCADLDPAQLARHLTLKEVHAIMLRMRGSSLLNPCGAYEGLSTGCGPHKKAPMLKKAAYSNRVIATTPQKWSNLIYPAIIASPKCIDAKCEPEMCLGRSTNLGFFMLDTVVPLHYHLDGTRRQQHEGFNDGTTQMQRQVDVIAIMLLTATVLIIALILVLALKR